uniref:Uncharacterized protein n=1 Tax=Rhizophora mucronata TaxID=61149 RepID=A0A2P2KPK0_RHIMU
MFFIVMLSFFSTQSLCLDFIFIDLISSVCGLGCMSLRVATIFQFPRFGIC